MKISDFLLGTAIGDAFGAGVEFQDRNWIREHVDFSGLVNARANIAVEATQQQLFTQNYEAWDYTDDTEMTVGLIKALMSQEPFSEDLLVQKWLEEYQKGVEEKGFGRNGHGSMSWFFSGEQSMDAIRAFQRHRKNPGNAPAMRAAPLGLISEALINDYAAINARATHPNPIAVLSSQCIARAAEFILVKKGVRTLIIDYCEEKVSLNAEFKRYLRAVNQLGDYESFEAKDFETLCGPQPIQSPYFLPGIYGLPSDSKYTTGAVLYLLKNCSSPMDALQKSIYLGGDVDSVASITTGILAGKYGLDTLPKYMLEMVEGKRYLEELANYFEGWLVNGNANL